jgi:hypothetical protein
LVAVQNPRATAYSGFFEIVSGYKIAEVQKFVEVKNNKPVWQTVYSFGEKVDHNDNNKTKLNSDTVTRVDSKGIPAGELAFFRIKNTKTTLSKLKTPECPYPSGKVSIEQDGNYITITDPKTKESFSVWLGEYLADERQKEDYENAAEGAYDFRPREGHQW